MIHALNDPKPVSIIADSHTGWNIWHTSFSHNNQIIASCSEQDNRIILSKVDTGDKLSPFQVCKSGVSVVDLCFSMNSTLLAFACDSGEVGIFNIKSK